MLFCSCNQQYHTLIQLQPTIPYAHPAATNNTARSSSCNQQYHTLIQLQPTTLHAHPAATNNNTRSSSCNQRQHTLIQLQPATTHAHLAAANNTTRSSSCNQQQHHTAHSRRRCCSPCSHAPPGRWPTVARSVAHLVVMHRPVDGPQSPAQLFLGAQELLGLARTSRRGCAVV